MSDKNLKKSDFGTVRPMVDSDLDLILKWRNNKKIRECMYTKKVISAGEHKAWYAEKCLQENQHLLL